MLGGGWTDGEAGEAGGRVGEQTDGPMDGWVMNG